MNDQNQKPETDVKFSYPVILLAFAAWLMLCGIASALVQYWVCDEPFKALIVFSGCCAVALCLLWLAVAEVRS